MPRWIYLTLMLLSGVTALVWLVNVALDAAQGASASDLCCSAALTLVWTLCAAGWGKRLRAAGNVR